MPRPMSRRKNESVWRTKTDLSARSAQDFGSSDSETDEVAAYLLEQGRLAASARERRALDQCLAGLHPMGFAAASENPDADEEATTFGLGEL